MVASTCKSKFAVSRARAARIKYSIIVSPFNDSQKLRVRACTLFSRRRPRRWQSRVYIILPQITLYSERERRALSRSNELIPRAGRDAAASTGVLFARSPNKMRSAGIIIPDLLPLGLTHSLRKTCTGTGTLYNRTGPKNKICLNFTSSRDYPDQSKSLSNEFIEKEIKFYDTPLGPQRAHGQPGTYMYVYIYKMMVMSSVHDAHVDQLVTC